MKVMAVSNVEGLKVKGNKVKGDLIYMVLDQMGDSAGSVTSQKISEKIHEVSGLHVENSYIDDFLQNSLMRFTGMLNQLLLAAGSELFVGALTSVSFVNFIKKNSAKVWGWIKSIGSVLTKGRGKFVNSVMVAGKGANSTELAKISNSIDVMRQSQNVMGALKGGSEFAQNYAVVGSEVFRNVEGDTKVPGVGSMIKAIDKYSNMARQGF